jgi:lipopolysaccharide/colanic/teichoic acid biosynthesis glycosyltransferase
MYKALVKPTFDFLAAAVGLVVLSPLFVVITLVLYFSNQGKPFFTQPRPGKNTKIFKIIKFKTMNDKKDVDGQLLPDSQRLTSMGSFIRKTSLDEIPQLINVLIGDMSLIGPRPLLTHYLHLYSDFQNRRHEVKPGITGWAQVNGRNAISWDKKFEYDVWYVDNSSFILDSKILLKTVLKVLKSEGLNEGNHATTSCFKGNINE